MTAALSDSLVAYAPDGPDAAFLREHWAQGELVGASLGGLIVSAGACAEGRRLASEAIAVFRRKAVHASGLGDALGRVRTRGPRLASVVRASAVLYGYGQAIAADARCLSCEECGLPLLYGADPVAECRGRLAFCGGPACHDDYHRGECA